MVIIEKKTCGDKGRPFDTTLSLTRFILTGGLDKFPTLKLVCAHVGGALPMLPGRFDFGYELRADMSFGPWDRTS